MELIIITEQVGKKGLYQCWLNNTEDFMEILVFQTGVEFWQVERKKYFRKERNEKAVRQEC